jgi:hypothetical protein
MEKNTKQAIIADYKETQAIYESQYITIKESIMKMLVEQSEEYTLFQSEIDASIKNINTLDMDKHIKTREIKELTLLKNKYKALINNARDKIQELL